MVDVLNFIKEKLEAAGINYQFGEWTGEIKYPYFVGECTSDDYVYENKKTSGTLILDGWTRNSRLELLKADEKIKKIFASLVAVVGNKAFFIRYGGSSMIPTGDMELKKITITLFLQEWEGE